MRFKTRETKLSQSIKQITKERLTVGSIAAAASLMAMGSMPVLAQDNASDDAWMGTLEEVIVQARRKDESIQDVPLTVNVVTGDDLDKLNIRNFADLQSNVAGLTLEEDSIAPNASVRGVRFDTFASGNNPTVEFYLNDSPISPLSAVQAMFDVGQVEVLRGPQGTLRGRASPSGSITITTRRPDLNEFGGYVDATGTDQGGQSYRAAVNIPLAEDKLALRFAGFYDENEGAQVKSILTGDEDKTKIDGWRVSLRAEPTDELSINLMHQNIKPQRWNVPHVESASIADPSLAASPVYITAQDRKGVADAMTYSSQELARTGLEVQYDFEGFQLNYAGSQTKQLTERFESQDTGDFFGPSDPRALDAFGQDLVTDTSQTSHEVRFSTSEPLLNDKLDFVVGALQQKGSSPTDLINRTAVFIPGVFASAIETPIERRGKSVERSIYGNATFYVTDDTELSVGARHISYEDKSSLIVSGNTIAEGDNKWSQNIFSLSLKQQFTDNMMGYFSYGSSWRPGIEAVGDFSVAKSPRQNSFLNLDPETSDSYELGIKSSWMDNRLRLNVAAYLQEFENYPYRAGGDGVFYVETEYVDPTDPSQGIIESVGNFNFVAAVPVTVYGIEVETFYDITENWNVNALMSWSKGEIDNGTIPCNVYGGTIPTIAEIRAATGGDNLASCETNVRSNYAPLWTATLQSEYIIPMGDLDAYVRGLVTMYGDSENDPTNPVDDVDAYQTVNLYAGIRDPEGVWEVMFYGKNVFEADEVLSRNAAVSSVSYRAPAATTGETSYRGVSIVAPREFGVNVRYNF